MFDIEEEKLPSALKDENRLNVLFAPLRNKSVNPKDWADKISSWKNIINIYCTTNDIYTISLSNLNSKFIRHGRPPSCLKEVFDEMIKNHEIETKEDFIKRSAVSWSGWLTDIVIKRPLSWSYNTIKRNIFFTSNIDTVYVYLEVIVKKSEELFSSIPVKCRNKLIGFKDLLDILNKDVSAADNVKLLLHYLTTEKKIAVKTVTGTNINEFDSFVIKVGDGHAPVSISDLDVGIYKLEENETILSKNIEDIEERIEECIKEAKAHLQKNHRQMAKNSLMKKHVLEKKLEKKSVALLNIQNCLEQLRGTHENVTIWNTYKSTLNAFNTTFKDTGLVEEAVDNTLSELADVLDQHEDIQAALARLPNTGEDNSELEQELEDLMKADTSDTNTNQDIPPDNNSGESEDLETRFKQLCLDLPDVPDSSPNLSTQETA
ncbi:charged multivesicular body protein 7 [Sitophilus oryzae]|uniref:Charged multivesicular body protein 7 n=1 Tax=Sitophilus oryzae TaxID=7048 RepID=A0A6J2XQU6_SITOR|nr:charged multivesicular body protein 7 [Sitophilus oryzae]